MIGSVRNEKWEMRNEKENQNENDYENENEK